MIQMKWIFSKDHCITKSNTSVAVETEPRKITTIIIQVKPPNMIISPELGSNYAPPMKLIC